MDLRFHDRKPGFGDLYCICGREHPEFPPSAQLDFAQFGDLQFSQIDDYFGVRTLSGDGDDIAVWLYPLVKGDAVHHHPGPFDALRIVYNVLRNPIERSDHFIRVVQSFSERLPVDLVYDGRVAVVDDLRRDIATINNYWSDRGITVGSDSAMDIDL